jgi:hypothetical protein
MREMLDIWPPLPIVVGVHGIDGWHSDNISAALEHNDRICELYLVAIPSSQSRKVLAAVRQPFQSLLHLHLAFEGRMAPVDGPDLLLGGSAPRLKSLVLKRLPVPGLPKLLSSTTHLVRLDLHGIPRSGYISAEAMFTALSTLTKLESLGIVFDSSQCRPDRNSRPLPQTRILLPVLTDWRFRGVSEYLEILVSGIDAPLLDKLRIIFFHEQIFDTPQLTQFISRAPNFKAHDEVHVAFSYGDVSATLPQISGGELELGVACESEQWDLLSLAQICGSSFPPAFIPAVEHFYVLDKNRIWGWADAEIENGEWLGLFDPFTAVKDLYLSPRFAPSIMLALQELIGESVTEVLPVLQTLFLEETDNSEPVQEFIGQFVAEQKLAGYIVTVSRWERDTDDE